MILRKIVTIVIQKRKAKEASQQAGGRVSSKKTPNISSLFHSTRDAE